MKIKNSNIQFESFNDGICDIYEEDEEGNKKYKYKGLKFSKRVLGFNRFFAAKAVQVKTNAVIRIPQIKGINNHDTLLLKGLGVYSIELIQEIDTTNPRCLDLTLNQLEMFEVAK
ncbi:hypothetical protein [Clostridium septicum]|uniref:hypothetical protein n=1 Tax=Clostridium septicum TaxID=1504 RepID=UPI00082DAE78|nr:hypothetical protein [Clostridium septicum]